MPRLRFKPTTPAVFKRAKTIHALDRAATVIGETRSYSKTDINTIHRMTIEIMGVIQYQTKH
jgi:hypothetical protein